MGYTQFILNCELKSETPAQIIATLKFMLDESKANLENVPEHSLFKTDEWKYIISGTLKTKPDGSYNLDITTSVKDNQGQIAMFLNWLAPYSNSEGFVGYLEPGFIDEEIRILFEKGKAYLVHPA